ncbi:hypothetical protein [Nocardia abscessus]|uniref:hypothetical protein n=1 Tax=Nocardia abscessus TaxID=120957 RepID=UPI002455CD82|nr:hypothetical protein [Nocardia abscessus]
MRIVACVMGVCSGSLWLWCAFLMLSSRFSTDPGHDPHGYGLIIGTVLAIPAGLLAALTLPFAFPAEVRTRAFGIALSAFAITSALLLGALSTA